MMSAEETQVTGLMALVTDGGLFPSIKRAIGEARFAQTVKWQSVFCQA